MRETLSILWLCKDLCPMLFVKLFPKVTLQKGTWMPKDKSFKNSRNLTWWFNYSKFNGNINVHEHIIWMIDAASKFKSCWVGIFNHFFIHLALISLHNLFTQLKLTYNTAMKKWELKKLISVCVEKEGRLKERGGLRIWCITMGIIGKLVTIIRSIKLKFCQI